MAAEPAAPADADGFGEPEPRPVNPMDLARRRVALQRKKKALERMLEDVTSDLAACTQALQPFMENGDFPEKSTVDEATVFLFRQIWASPVGGDHDRLTAVLDALGLDEYKPSTVNTQSLSAYVREEIKKAPVFDDDGNLLTLEQRARRVLPQALVDALNITEKRDVRVNGA